MRKIAAHALAIFGLALSTAASSQIVDKEVSIGEASLEAFVDAAVTSDMQNSRSPGLTLSIVRDDKVVLLKGYGYADLASKIPVDPSIHMFRIGSVTKPFTFTALMQLVEQGRVDLDADVNEYLTAFKIPETFDEPVRVRDLLTHRPGFEETIREMWGRSDDDFRPLGDWLQIAMPERSFPPGKTTSYSNFGAALAGYIVQEVSGELFEDYLEKNILGPLGMTSTTSRQLLDPSNPQAMRKDLRNQIATVYSLGRGYPEQKPFELVVPAPAGSMSSTAYDMTHFMRAHLAEGKLGNTNILHPETAIQMRLRPYPGRPGADYAHGFRSGALGGYQTFEHSGATLTSYSAMIMIPELELGVFIAVNGGQNALSPERIAQRILLRMMENQVKSPSEPVTLSKEKLQQYAGSYLTTRRVFSNFAKIFGAAIGGSNVTVTGNNTLLVAGNASVSEYLPLGDDHFMNPTNRESVFFLRNNSGKVTGYVGEYGHTTSWRMTSDTNILVLLTGLGLAVLVAISILTTGWFNRSSPKPETKLVRYLSRSAIIASLGVLGVAILIAYFVFRAMHIGPDIIYDWPIPSATLLLSGILVLLFATVLFAVLLIINLKTEEIRVGRKIHFGLFGLALGFFLFQANNWHMIGFNYW